MNSSPETELEQYLNQFDQVQLTFGSRKSTSSREGGLKLQMDQF